MSRRWHVLARDIDEIDQDSRSDAEIVANLMRERPLWLRIANFQRRSATILRMLPKDQLVLWKLEHWGASTGYERLPVSSGVAPEAEAARVVQLGQRLAVYTFVEQNRGLLVADVPVLRQVEIAVLPIALKPPTEEFVAGRLREELGVGPSTLLLGAGGLLHPAKGIDELAMWFLRTVVPTSGVELICHVIPQVNESVTAVRGRWTHLARTPDSARLHVRLGNYGQWDRMCAFYGAVDAVLVNSRSDSWGRMVSEPVGLGVPVIVRTATCGTNWCVPETVRVDAFADLSWPAFGRVLDEARARAPRLRDVSRRRHGPVEVGRQFLTLMGRQTPPDRRCEFERLAVLPRSRRLLAEMLTH